MVDSSLEYQVPRGGPIYLQDLVGPITRVSDFETSLVHELQSLTAELEFASSSSQFPNDEVDVSVDELKVFSEEELVDKALKEAFQVEPQPENPSQLQQEVSEEATDKTASASNECLSGALVERDNKEGKLVKSSKKGMKRGRAFDRDTRAAELENRSYIEKVEQLAKIKQKQDEDKIAARLHSFNGGCKSSEGLVSTSSSENIGKMKSLRYITSVAKVRKTGNVDEHVGISYPEVVLCVEVFNMSKIWVKIQELLVLGSQMLSELRDQIYCSTDQLMQKAGQHDPSGYFLIEDVFCNDKRDPSAIDYSEPIFDWLRESKDEAREKWECIQSGELQRKHRALFGNKTNPCLPHFKAVEMHKIRFCDLPFRLGAGYLYCHQGDCKHIVVIRDMRLIHPEDIQNRAAYPVTTFQLKSRYLKCSVCRIYRATKVTVDDKWAQENPCYFCDNCYYLLHYKEDGSLLYTEFTVYDYHHE